MASFYRPPRSLVEEEIKVAKQNRKANSSPKNAVSLGKQNKPMKHNFLGQPIIPEEQELLAQE